MSTVSAREWGSRNPSGAGRFIGQVPLVISHHSWRPHVEATAGEDAEKRAMRGMENYHMDHHGWQGIGYNFCVFQSGRVYEGRGWGRGGAHTKGKNSSSLGVCFVIDGNNHIPTEDAWDATLDLIHRGISLGHIATDYAVDGHRDHQPKDCPGHKVYPLLEEKLGPSSRKEQEPGMELTKDDLREVLEDTRHKGRLAGIELEERTNTYTPGTYVDGFLGKHGEKWEGAQWFRWALVHGLHGAKGTLRVQHGQDGADSTELGEIAPGLQSFTSPEGGTLIVTVDEGEAVVIVREIVVPGR